MRKCAVFEEMQQALDVHNVVRKSQEARRASGEETEQDRAGRKEAGQRRSLAKQEARTARCARREAKIQYHQLFQVASESSGSEESREEQGVQEGR